MEVVLCIKDLKFDYKSWGQSKNNYYSSIYSNCYYCGDVCDENYYTIRAIDSSRNTFNGALMTRIGVLV
jgi:hypothetical protein